MFKTGAQMLVLVLVAGLFLLRESRLRPCAMVEEAFCDWLSLNGPGLGHVEPAPVTLVAIDDGSLADHAWPWKPIDYSLFVQDTEPFHPEVTVFGEILNWEHLPAGPGERQMQPQFETMLHDELLRCPKALLAARLGWPDDPQVVPPLQEAPLLRKVTGDLRLVPEWTVIEHQAKEEYRLAAAQGFTNILPGTETIHTAPLVLRYRGEIVPSLVLQAVVMWEKLSLDDVTVELGSHISLGEKLQIPIDESGQMRVNFGAPRTLIGFDDLLLANEQLAAHQKPVAPVDRIKGGVVLLARTDAAARTLPMGAGRKGSEGELFAAAIATIQKQAFIQRISVWFDLALIVLAAVASLWIPLRKKKTVAAIALITLLAYGLGAMILSAQRICIPLVLPVGLVLFALAYRLATPNPPEAPATAAPRPQGAPAPAEAPSDPEAED